MNNHRDSTFLNSFGNHLKKIRESKNLSQEKLANLSEISDTQIARIERGEVNPTICTLKIIAEALDLKLHELFLL